MFSKGDREVERRLKFTPQEKPLIAQIWGLIPGLFEKAAEKLVTLGFDGVDINMGCPDKAVIKKGAGGALVDNWPLAQQIIQATKQGLAGRLPISVKIRIGNRRIVTEEWVERVLSTGIDALIIHGRTVKEQSRVPAHWDEIGKAVKIRNTLGVQTLIIGNGDVRTLDEANYKVAEYGVDGVMIGRGVFEDPFVFNTATSIDDLTLEQRLRLLSRHLELYEQAGLGERQFQSLKKFIKVYVSGISGIKVFRNTLMQVESLDEMKHLIA
jgi:tRNA-dihydrouridine synthase